MKPETNSFRLLGITRSKAKMYEYSIPAEHHIKLYQNPSTLFPLSIGLLGDFAAQINGEEQDPEESEDLEKKLSFSARFFDAYLHAQLNNSINPYLLLLGSASYYLCKSPGNSFVLANEIGKVCPDLEGLGLENLLHWILRGIFYEELAVPNGPYKAIINQIIQRLHEYYASGKGDQELFKLQQELRQVVYQTGTPRQLLFADIVCAVIKKRYENSTWYSLPKYSDIPVNQWADVFRKPLFMRELWPAQHILGEHNIYRGKSAVIQMPTSAGKTKATEIVIRSAFLSNRTSLVVVVAPFRTLCHEIKGSFIKAFRREDVHVDELSDVYQIDFSVDQYLGRKQILIVTPEKLNYILHHIPELGSKIGLAIFDEGHQFDNGTRGITYELLITSLKELLPKNAQKILISAVIRNADQVGEWLNGKEAEVISGTDLANTNRSIGFASWQDTLGRIWFVNPQNINEDEFFVPRVIQQYELHLRNNRENVRWFPDRSNENELGKDISLYLGLKLVPNGSVAIYCGKKSTVQGICRRVIDIFNRQVPLVSPLEFSNRVEIYKLENLIIQNLGRESVSAQCIRLGVFAHHSNVPDGIRLAVEHAFKEGLIKFVICTSTLAQGVNLPIRYLIVTATRQGREEIKVRDFQNLIGRSGRSGMQTEGSILFSDPDIFDHKNDEQEKWDHVKKLLNPKNTEPCGSTLFTIFDLFKNDKKRNISIIEPLDLVKRYVEGSDVLDLYLEDKANNRSFQGLSIDGLREQVKYRLKIVSAIESYLMAHLDNANVEFQEDAVVKLARGTLAYSLGNNNQKEQIEKLFVILARNIEQTIKEPELRILYGKTLFGIHDSQKISNWINENSEALLLCNSDVEVLDLMWPLFFEMIESRPFARCTQPTVLKDIMKGWIDGLPFSVLYVTLLHSDAKIFAPKRPSGYKLEDLVQICEDAIAFEGALILGAIIDLLQFSKENDNVTVNVNLQNLMKRIKYGLPSAHAMVLYESGFADRIVSMDLATVFEDLPPTKEAIIHSFKERQEQVFGVLDNYPSYFSDVYRNLSI